MATSGSKTILVANGTDGSAAVQLRFRWTETATSIADNTSTLSCYLELISGVYGAIISSASKSYSVTVNGVKYTGTNTIGNSANTTKTLWSKTGIKIAHNSDGTKTFAYSFSQTFDMSFNGSVGTKSGSGSGTLSTIPRKSSLSVSNGTLGAEQTLTVTRQSSGFTHTITYKCEAASGTICTKSSDTSIKWTPPVSLAAQNTTGTTVSVVFTITTYNGNTSVGSNTKTISCSIPASVKPSCTIAVSDAAGYATYGWLKGLSKVSYTVIPTTSQGSAIASYSVSIDGKTYKTASGTSDILTSAGSVTITAKVTDKRGRSGSTSTTITVLDYVAPVISKLTVGRCDADGTANMQGEYVNVTYSGSILALGNKNTAKYVLKYKKASASAYTSVSLSTSYSVTDGTKVIPADSGSTYNIVLEASDAIKTTTKSTTASTGFSIIHYPASGKGIAFGKISEHEGVMDIAWETYFQKSAKMQSYNTGYYLMNGNKESVPGLYHNDTNLWIGGTSTAGSHITGSLYISAGSDESGIHVSKLVGGTRTNYILLDAQNYNQYALPLSGGTMTGNLYFGPGSNYYLSTVGNVIANNVQTKGYLKSDTTLEVTGNSTLNGKVYSKGIYNATTTNASNVRIGTSYDLMRYSSSSKRYKHAIKNLTEEELLPEKLLDLPVRQFIYNLDYLSETDNRYNCAVPGFIAEEVAKYYPIAADLDDDGQPEDWGVKWIVPPMLALIQRLYNKVDALERGRSDGD